MPNDVAGTLAGIDALMRRVDDATARIVAGAGNVYKRIAQENAPVGEPENSTNPPGDLSRSIISEAPRGGDGEWSTRVGPTVATVNPGRGGKIFNYGRLREFGGVIGPQIAPYLVFNIAGRIFRKVSVYQEGSFYLTRARQEGSDEVEQLMAVELTAAVRGY